MIASKRESRERRGRGEPTKPVFLFIRTEPEREARGRRRERLSDVWLMKKPIDVLNFRPSAASERASEPGERKFNAEQRQRGATEIKAPACCRRPLSWDAM